MLLGSGPIDGVTLQVMKSCDLHKHDVPDLRDYLEKQGFPVAHIENGLHQGLSHLVENNNRGIHKDDLLIGVHRHVN